MISSIIWFLTSKYVLITLAAVLVLCLIGRFTKLIPVRLFEVLLGIIVAFILLVLVAAIYNYSGAGQAVGIKSFRDLFH